MSSRRRALGPLLLLASCAREEPPPPDAPPWTLPAVELGGCAAITRGPACELSEAEREVRVWVAAPSLRATAQLGARALPVVAVASGEGTRLSVEIPADALPELARAEAPLELTVLGGRGDARHAVPLRRYAEHPALARARALRREGKLDEARASLAELAGAEPALVARAESLSARLALAAGDVDGATSRFEGAMALHRAAGRVSDEALDAFALAFSRREKRDFAGARAALDGARDAISAWDEGRAHAAYYLALVERDRGSSTGALTLLAEAESRASRLGAASLLHDVRDVRARLLQQLGRSAEADATLRRMDAERPAGLSPCRAGELANNLAWNELLRAEAGEPLGAAVLSSLDEAADVFRRLCPRPAHLQTVLVNRALAALAMGQTKRAAELSREARAAYAEPSAEVLFWLLDLEARVALAEGRADEALARYDELLRRADAAALPEVAWRALVGLGDARLARGDGAAAVLAYRDAESRLDAAGLGVPLEEGRAAFLAGRARGAEKLALALLARGDVASALTAVRVARARALAAAARQGRVGALPPAERQRWDAAVGRHRRERDALAALAAGDWKLSRDKLAAAASARAVHAEAAARSLSEALALLDEGAPGEPPPLAPGDVLLAAVRAAPGELAVFFAEPAGVVSARVLEGPPRELAERLLAPFGAELARARRLRVLSDGLPSSVDLHALPFRGQPLLATLPVVYAVDLPAAPPRALASDEGLIVADPRGDLPAARSELAAIRTALGARALTVLEGREATRAAVEAGLARAALFHYAGHGVFGEGVGADSKLLLAEGAELSAAEVLLAPAVPRWVVLSGCETARVESHRVLGLGLATAFVAAGSDVVVAATRPVPDALAATISAAFHQHLARGLEPAAALREAQLAVAAAEPDSDWAAYRAVVR